MDTGGPAILYVEDEPETREIIAGAIAAEYPDLPLFVAADGAEGLELFRRHRPEVVVTDIRMPVMDGLVMAGEIKGIDTETEIIALTAYSDTGFLVEAIEIGFSHYVLKPTDFGKLFAAIEKSMGVVRLRRRVHQQAAELERRLAELDESEERLRATFNQAAVGIGHLAPDGKFIRINRKYCDIAGCDVGEMESLHLEDFTHPDDLPICMERHRLLAEGAIDSYSLEKRFVHRDGAVVWASLTASIVKGPEGDPRFIVGIIDDITERKKAEEALRRSELKFSTIFHAVPALIVMTTLADEICLDINEAGLRMLGYARDEIIGRSLFDLGVWESPDVRGRLVRLLEEQGSVRDEEVRFRAKDGRTLAVLLSKQPIRFESERYLLSAATDITQRKELEEEIARLNIDLAARAAELQEANRELESFNYTVAHDLRKPLTVINGYCQALKEICGEAMGADCLAYVDKAYDGTVRMNGLIDALLLFGQAAHAEPKREAVDLSRTAESVAEELKLAEPWRKVQFRIEQGIEVEGDAALLRAVIANFFGNAWKYTVSREEAVIEFGTAEAEGKRAFFVRDNGIGFDSSEAGDVFTPFRRLPDRQRVGGLGIGLATVQRIIARHGGRVWAEGEPGKGATFYFTLG